MLASYLFVPPSTFVNQYLPISWEVLLFFQNLNSSKEADNLPNPAWAFWASVREVPDGDISRAPILPIREPVTSPIEPVEDIVSTHLPSR